MAIITTKDLTLAYDGADVVKNLNISIDKGDYLCIIGENGSGKSTLAKALLGLITPVCGKIEYNNITKNRIGYLPQQTNVQKDFPASVYEIVMSGFVGKTSFFPFYTKKQKQKADKIMKTLGIIDIKKSCYNELSGGQQQRILLSRALCGADNILVLDEPVANLDPVITNELYDILHTLNKNENYTIIMVSHDMHSVKKYATKVLHLAQNNYVFDSAENYINSSLASDFIGGELNADN